MKYAIGLIILLILGTAFMLYTRTPAKPALYSQITNQVRVTQPVQNTQLSSPSASPSPKAPQAAQDTIITVTKNGFSPDTITIQSGTRVIWQNNSGDTATVNSDPHPVHTAYPPLNLGEFATGTSVQLVFDKPGTYTYHNHLNPSQKGTVLVK